MYHTVSSFDGIIHRLIYADAMLCCCGMGCCVLVPLSCISSDRARVSLGDRVGESGCQQIESPEERCRGMVLRCATIQNALFAINDSGTLIKAWG